MTRPLGSKNRRPYPIRNRVIQMDLQGNEIARFDSAREASIKTGVYYGGINQCCNKVQSTAGKFKWKHDK